VFVAECHVDAHVLLSDLLVSKLCISMMTLLLFPCSIVKAGILLTPSASCLLFSNGGTTNGW